MSRLNLAQTKSSQLVLKRSLSMATEGFTLLEQKREILVMELMRLLDRAKQVLEPDAGRIAFAGTDFTALKGERLRRMRGRIQMVFQDPARRLQPARDGGAGAR